jgi:dipeptidyl-peptidase 4
MYFEEDYVQNYIMTLQKPLTNKATMPGKRRNMKRKLACISLFLVVSFLSGCEGSDSSANPNRNSQITARELVSTANALAGPDASCLVWSPQGERLSYVLKGLLYLYNPATKTSTVILNPAGKADSIDVTSAQWSPRGDKMLLTGTTSLWLLDIASGSLASLTSGGNITAVMFSPAGDKISYVKDNNLYAGPVPGPFMALTSDGSQAIFNGCLDWVYNEELATRAAQAAYAWSPDGKYILYLKLNDTNVNNDPVTDYTTIPATVTYVRYPAAGTNNPVASLWMHNLVTTATSKVATLESDDGYVLPFFVWTPDSGKALYITVSRNHRTVVLNAYNPTTGTGSTVMTENSDDWINEDKYAAPVFLDNNRFLWISERSGFMHLYICTMAGSAQQLTSGNWLIDNNAYNLLIPGRPVYVDPTGTWAYFSATKESPLERHIYRVNIATGSLEKLSSRAGFHFMTLSGNGRYVAEKFSSVDTPPITSVLTAEGDAFDVISRCTGPALTLPNFTREFLVVKAHDGVDLYAQMVRPPNFNPGLKYPVIVHWYGGPGLQLVTNQYGTTNIFNHIERDTLYTQAGVIVWRLDNRGSFGRGHFFERPIYGQLGPEAIDDQVAGVEYLHTLPYVDASKIGTDGKSFGGFMTLYALIHRPDIFRCGVAGSGPTNWLYYDTIYTERYMNLPSLNAASYSATNLIPAAKDIGGIPLIIHGTMDTNVHLQNSMNFIEELDKVDKPYEFIPLPGTNHRYAGDALVEVLSSSVEFVSRQLK